MRLEMDDTPIPIKEASLRWTWRRRISISAFSTVVFLLIGIATGWFDITGDNVMLTRTIVDGMFMIILAWMGIAAADDLGHKFLETQKDKKDAGPTKPAG